MSRKTAHASLLCVALLSLWFLHGAPTLAAEAPDPSAVVTLADVQAVLGGKFTSSSPEPGVLVYEEGAGGYRVVNVYLSPADGKTVEAMKAQFVAWGEPVEDVAGVDDAAMYRPQRSEATVEKKDESGEVWLLSVTVQNAANADDTKRFAVELAKRGAARL